MSEIPAEVAEWTEGLLGTFQIALRFAHDHGYSQLWRLEAEEGRFYWLKCHQYPGKWAGEVHALTRWTQALGLDAPEVRGFRTDPLAVVLSEVPGIAAGTVELEQRAEERLWSEAGAYLARLHTMENEWLGAANPDGTPQGKMIGDPAGFVRSSIENRLEQGRDQGLFDAAEQEFITFGAREWTTALAGEIPRAIHRDYSPRNWMTTEDGTLTGVIDFEHARWDVRAADLNRWWDKEFLNKPHLAHAFFEAYIGALPDARLEAQIKALRLLGAAAGIVWATEVGDAPYAQQNREALHRLMEGTIQKV